MSRQREWQYRQRSLGNCTSCGKKANGKSLCTICLEKARKYRLAKYKPSTRANEMKSQGWLTKTEAANYLRISKGTLNRWAIENKIRFTRFGVRGDKYYKQEDLITK